MVDLETYSLMHGLVSIVFVRLPSRTLSHLPTHPKIYNLMSVVQFLVMKLKVSASVRGNHVSRDVFIRLTVPLTSVYRTVIPLPFPQKKSLRGHW